MAVSPFGSSAENVRDLVLDVSEGTRLGAKVQRVGDPVVERWLEEAAARVNLRVAGYEQALAGTTYEDQVETAGRHLVELYAAALLWDATHPERGGGVGGGGGRLSDSLMARFSVGLDELAAFLARVLGTDPDAGAGGDQPGVPGLEPVVAGDGVGAAAVFPPPMFSVRSGW